MPKSSSNGRNAKSAKKSGRRKIRPNLCYEIEGALASDWYSKSDRQIARELGTSPTTVGKHISHHPRARFVQ